MKKLLNNIDKKKLSKLVIILFSLGIFIAIVGSFMPKSSNEIRQEKIDQQFSFDGSHKLLKKAVKTKLQDPDTFKHIRTNSKVNGSCLIVKMDYSAKNYFGVHVQHRAIGAFKIDGSVLNITYGWE